MKLRYPIGTVKHIAIDEDVDSVLSMVDVVIYASFLEDQSFPDILKRGMCFEKPIIAPDLSMIKKYVSLYVLLLFTHAYMPIIYLCVYTLLKNIYSDGGRTRVALPIFLS